MSQTTFRRRNFGNTVNIRETDLETATNEFHIYTIEWTPDFISFSVDDYQFYRLAVNNQNDNTWPFSLIFNIAEGTLGGSIPTEFTGRTMKVNYLRVYQQ